MVSKIHFFLERLSSKKKKLNSERKLGYNDLWNDLNMRESLSLFEGNKSFYPTNISCNYSKIDEVVNKPNKTKSFYSQKEQILPQIIGKIFEEFGKREFQLPIHNYLKMNQRDQSSMWLKFDGNEKWENHSWDIYPNRKGKSLMKGKI